jgi:threonine/homoserine/homoserine lactone efflux protein
MDTSFLLKAIMIGVAVAAPVGPMSMLCIQQTLSHGRAAGLAAGAGIALADGTYAAIAAFGVGALAPVLLRAEFWLKIVGALVFLYLGARAITRRARPSTSQNPPGSAPKSLAMAYVLTLSNPPTILFFAGVYGSVANLSGTGQSLLFAGGVLAGSMLWWMLLSAVFGRARHALNPKTIRAANAIAGVILCGFGLYGLIDVMLGAREKRA